MAEGVDVEATVPGAVEEEGLEQVVTTEDLVMKDCIERVVRPKEKKPLLADPSPESQEDMEKGVKPAGSGFWWHSSALTGPGDSRARTSPPPLSEAGFQGWR